MRYVTAALLIPIMAGLSGCGLADKAVQTAERAAENAIEKATGVPVAVDANQKSLSFKGDNGEQITLTVPGGGEVPEGFPLPLLKGGTIAGVAKVNNADQKGWLAQLQFDASSETVAEYYEQVTKDRGFKVDRIRAETKGEPTLNLILESATEGGLLSISLNETQTTTMTLLWTYK